MFQDGYNYYVKYIKSALKDQVSLCRVDLLFRNYIVKKYLPINKRYKQLKLLKYKNYFVNFILAFYSLINILIIKLKGIKIAHYMIDIDNSKTSLYDFRNEWLLKILPVNKSVNFMHINNAKYSLKTLFKKQNVIYFEAIYYVLKPFLSKKRYEYKKTGNEKANEILEINQNYYNDSYWIKKISRIILKFLDIEKFIMLDDTRYTNELKLACKELNIKTIGYMHGRFNKYHLGIFEFPFDIYMVWSDYFKKMLLQHKNYKDKEIVVIGNPKLDKKINFIKKGKNILWLGESNVNYEEIFSYIKKMKQLGYEVIFRGKPASNANIDEFLEKNGIKKDKSINFFKSLEENNIGLVVATYSTTLMESWLLGVPSIALKCSYDYGSHLWEDGLVELCKSEEELETLINKHLDMSDEEIRKICVKIWGEDYVYNREKVEQVLS